MDEHSFIPNPVESLNAGLEKMCLELAEYFLSLKALEVNIFHPGGQFAGQVVEKGSVLYPIDKLSHPAEVRFDL